MGLQKMVFLENYGLSRLKLSLWVFEDSHNFLIVCIDRNFNLSIDLHVDVFVYLFTLDLDRSADRGLVSMVVLASADALCAPVTPIMDWTPPP